MGRNVPSLFISPPLPLTHSPTLSPSPSPPLPLSLSPPLPHAHQANMLKWGLYRLPRRGNPAAGKELTPGRSEIAPPPLFITAGAGGREGVMPAPQLANAGSRRMLPCPLSSLLLAGSSREGAPGFPSDGGEFTRRALPTGQPLPERLQRLATSRILTHHDAHALLPPYNKSAARARLIPRRITPIFAQEI